MSLYWVSFFGGITGGAAFLAIAIFWSQWRDRRHSKTFTNARRRNGARL